jgi:hypothetical protein
MFVAIGCAVLMIALFITFYVLLGRGITGLQQTVWNGVNEIVVMGGRAV